MRWELAYRIFFGAVLLFAAGGTAKAQSGASTPQDKAMPQADAATLKAAFQQAFETYKQELVAIEVLRSEYHSAEAARRKQINNQLRERHPQSAAILDKMVKAALAAYQSAPETDQQITDLLQKVAAHRMLGSGANSQGGDDYEAALEVINALVEGGNRTKELPVWGILAAYATNELDKAAMYRDMAQSTGAFAVEPVGKAASDVVGLAQGMSRGIEQQRQLWQAEKAIRDAEAKADDLPRVRMTTSEGELIIELFENEAPQAVANFVTLVKDKFYDGVIFHRVLPRFMAQGGDPQGTGTGGPGYNIRCECYQPNARMHFRGSLSMAHAGRDSGGSQFFLTFLPTAHLNPNPARQSGHTVFGRVIEGFDVLAKLVRVNPGEAGLPESRIVKAEVIRDRGHDYSQRFEKLPGR